MLHAGVKKEFMQVETAGFQVFCCVHSTQDVKESTKDAMGQRVCHIHSMCRDIAFTACKMHSAACAKLNGSFFTACKMHSTACAKRTLNGSFFTACKAQ